MRQEIIGLILEHNGKFLVERRKKTKTTVPGSVIFPGGHVEPGETRTEAVIREAREELGIKVKNPQLVYHIDFDCEEEQTIYWYVCHGYEGKLEVHEAEELVWISPREIDIFTYDVSRQALRAYLDNQDKFKK